MLLPGLLHADNSLRVLTSIRPLQMITNEIMQDVGQADVLISAAQSPHHFQLKPSQMKLASRADLLIWISNDFEAGLKRLQHTLPEHSQKLQLLPLLNLETDEGEHDGDEDDHEHQHGHMEGDGHIWLSPDIVIDIARLISQQLASMDATHAARYRQNSERLIERVKQWKLGHYARLHQVQPSYILDHRFLSHFERSMALQPHDSLRDSHDGHASIRHLSRLQATLKRAPVKCLLVSKLPLSAQARQISEQFKLRVQLIETLGTADTAQTITGLFNDIASALEFCQL